MDNYIFYRRPNLVRGLLALLFMMLLSAHSVAANLPLEIFQPQPNLDTKNRFYKAYPGLEYNVRLAVAGGDFPYQFELTDVPQGMTIDARGEISWPSPTASETPYQVAASVTDSEGATKSVSWTITVTTTGFLFVDAGKGKTKKQGGTGTFSDPWKTMKDVYGGDVHAAKGDAHHSGSFVYWRQGKYILDAYVEDCTKEEGCRVPWSGRQPIVWIAYPGERPEINFNSGGQSGYIFFYDNVRNLYLDGFDFNLNSNDRGKGIAIGSNGNITVRKNIFRGLTDCTHRGTNNSQLFFVGGEGKYSSVQDNTASESSCGYWLLGYGSPKTVVEDNHISTNLSLPIGPKSDINNWTIRGNVIQTQKKISKGAIWIQDFGTSGNIEINFNLIQMSQSDSVALRLISSNPSGPIYVNRNTFVGHVAADWLSNEKGPWTFAENVIINNFTSSDKIKRNSVNEKRLILNDNLSGDFSDNIVNSQGLLTSNYSKFINSRGHQIGSQPSQPSQPPSRLSPPIIDSVR